MDKYLIINADDFGMCHAQNMATMELLERGSVTSATIMAPCPWAYEAVLFAQSHPQLAIGVHLTTTSEWQTYRWGPLTGAASLTDDEGFMHRRCAAFADAADMDELRAELTAQTERLMAMGLTPSHMDNHMGSLYGIDTGRFELLTAVIELAGRYGLPLRFPRVFTDAQYANDMLGIRVPREQIDRVVGQFCTLGEQHGVAMVDYLMPGDWNGPQRDSFDNYREYIYELYRTFDNGVTETYIHPARECDELKAITGNWQRRVWEYELFRDPRTMQHIRSLGIQLIDYRQLKAMRAR